MPMLSRLLALLEATKHPYVIIGDWQNPPDTIAGTVLPAKFHFGILAPDHSVLSGNVLDYGLLHEQLASTTALTTDWAVPWRPHALLTLNFDIEAATREYRQIQQFPPLPKVPDIDFRPWTTYQSQAHELCLYDNPTNAAAQLWADWLSKTEQYILQEHPWAAQGRGANLRAVTKPLLPMGSTRTWRKGRPAFWEQLGARFQLALKQPAEVQHGPVRGFMKVVHDVQKHWHGLQHAVAAYRDLHTRLQQLGLRVNAKKIAFLATDKATDRELKALLQPHEPQVATVMRDLGIDLQAARRRRIPVMKQRFAKAHQRKLKLRSLKIPSLKVRLRLHKGGIQPVALWGIEAQGLAPRYRLALRAALANQLGHHHGGSLDATFDLHSNKYIDPADQVIIHHVKALHTLYHAWPTDQIEHLEQAWTSIYQQLNTKSHPWYTVKGPMAATIAYLHEWQWQAPTLHHWTRPETNYLTANDLSLRQPWWQIERALLKEANSQRTSRLAQRQYHQHLVAGLDWHVFRQLIHKLPKEHRTYLRTWVQGAIHFREQGKPSLCSPGNTQTYSVDVQVAQRTRPQTHAT